jgi:hypothetical protein
VSFSFIVSRENGEGAFRRNMLWLSSW